MAAPVPVATVDKEDIPPEAATGFRAIEAVRSDTTMVGAANPHASRAGLSMLRAGGSAVDAAIAMAVMLTLVEPQSSGLGGGAFMLHFDAASGDVRAFDGRETAPQAATADMFLKADGTARDFYDAVVGGLSVGVPGELRALELAHRRYGKLDWARLFEPAIELAEKGFPISARLHKLVSADKHLAVTAKARSYFYQADGSAKPVGTVLTNHELAAVFRAVAQGGADAFYQGDIARDIVRTARDAPRNPGRLTEADLAGYVAVERDPVCRSYRRYELCGMPPPTSGGVTVLQIMGLLERFDAEQLNLDEPLGVHLFAEASRLAYADRALYLADPDFASVPVEALLSPAYLQQRSKQIDPERTMGVASPGEIADGHASRSPDGSLELPSTSHMVAVDASGNVVTMTASIESAFGSRLMVRGFLLNNELTDFSFVAEHDGRKVANRIEPGKRPRSSMAPLLAFEREGERRRFHLAVGSPGGSRIIDYVARTLVQVLDGGLDVQAAIARPNIINRNAKTELEASERWQPWIERIQKGLEQRGHEVEIRDLNSGLQGVSSGPRGYLGGADPRREGLIVGD